MILTGITGNFDRSASRKKMSKLVIDPNPPVIANFINS